jgi:hypothetical protein
VSLDEPEEPLRPLVYWFLPVGLLFFDLLRPLRDCDLLLFDFLGMGFSLFVLRIDVIYPTK